MKRVATFVYAAALLAALAGHARAQDNRGSTTRYTSTGYINSFSTINGPTFYASAGDRIVSLVSPGEGASVDLKLWSSLDGVNWSLVQDEWGGVGTNTRKIDRVVVQSRSYRTAINTGFSWGNYIFSTDYTPNGAPAATGGADTCFGATGPNCNFWPSPGECSRSSTGTLSCNTSVGSQKHDTCCSAFPTGNNCAIGGTSTCSGEWSIAWDDWWWGRDWRRTYDPTFVSYRDSSRVTQAAPGTWAEGTPNATSYLAPVGTKVRLNDAIEGFCQESGCFQPSGNDAYCQSCISNPPDDEPCTGRFCSQ